MNRAHTSHDSSTTRNRGGRGLDSTRDPILREAVLELLAEVGYDRLTIDAVAARARAGKTTIYRRWPGKAELVVDALNNAKGTPETPDTGSLRDDLSALAASLTDTESRFGAQLTIGMLNALVRDAELRRVFNDRFISPRMAAFRAIFERAVTRGEIADGHDLDLLARVFPALALQQLVISGEMPTMGFARRIMEQLVYPLATAPSADTAPASGTGGSGNHQMAADRRPGRKGIR